MRLVIHRRQESLQALAARHGLTSKTVAKWRKRPTVQEARMAPAPASTVPTAEEEALAVGLALPALEQGARNALGVGYVGLPRPSCDLTDVFSFEGERIFFASGVLLVVGLSVMDGEVMISHSPF